MTQQEAMLKKERGDWVTVGKMLSISTANAAKTACRPAAKKHKDVINALIRVVEARESTIKNAQSSKTK